MSAWPADWTAKQAPAVDFAWVTDDEAKYVDRGDGFAYCDLGLAGASGGVAGISRFRVADPARAGQWQRFGNDFDFLFVIAGSVDVEGPDGQIEHLAKYSAAQHPQGYRYRLVNPSADLDAVHVTAPAAPLRAADADGPAAAPIYSHDSPDAYEVGAGPRTFFAYRDLGTSEPTDGRIHLHLVAATGATAGGTGYHYHTMAQWFMVLDGSAVTHIEGHEPLPLTFGNSQCLGAGLGTSHNAYDVSAEYRVIEMCMPTEYDTFAVEAPADAPA